MEERKYYPLSSAQYALIGLANLVNDLNATALIAHVDFRSDINDDVMIRAIQETYRRLPYCRVRIHRDEEGSLSQYLSDEPAPAVPVEYLTSEQEKHQDEIFRKWNLEYMPDGFFETCLTNMRLIHYEDGHKGLYYCIQHIIMDGYAGIYTLEYVSRVYIAMMEGKELPAPGPLPWDLVLDDMAYVGSEEYNKKLAKFVDKHYVTEPQFTSINGLGSHEFFPGKRYGEAQHDDQFFAKVIRHPMDKAFTDRIDEAAAKSHLSPQIYFLLAIRSYLAAVSDSDDVMVNCLISRRSTKYQKAAGMTLANSHWVRTIYPDTVSFSEALSRVYDVQSDCYRNARLKRDDVVRLVHERFNTPPEGCYGSVWLTYFPKKELPLDTLNLDVDYVSQGFIPIPLYVMILPDSTRGTMSATYWHAYNYIQPESIEKLHAFTLKFLTKGIENPDKSIKELVNECL